MHVYVQVRLHLHMEFEDSSAFDWKMKIICVLTETCIYECPPKNQKKSIMYSIYDQFESFFSPVYSVD